MLDTVVLPHELLSTETDTSAYILQPVFVRFGIMTFLQLTLAIQTHELYKY